MAEPRSQTGMKAWSEASAKIDVLTEAVGNLAEAVNEDRNANARNIKEIYKEISLVRDRAGEATKITWPLIVTTFSAMLGFAALIAGLGNYAISNVKETFESRIEARDELAKAHKELADAKLKILMDTKKEADLVRSEELAFRRNWMMTKTEEVAAQKADIESLRRQLYLVDEEGSRKWNSGDRPR